ncbi:hypothetical protein ACJX0J_006938, partial [Zea mays]
VRYGPSFVPELARWTKMSFFSGGGSKNHQRTFRAKKSLSSPGNKAGTSRLWELICGFLDIQGTQLRRHIDATLGSGNLREAVRLPVGEDLNEWLAVNTVDFFNHINVLYSTLAEFCTPHTCPVMAAGPKYEYRWADGEPRSRCPSRCPRPRAPFPTNFRDVVVKTIFRRLFRVYAHIYHSHFQMIVKLKEEAHLNTCFKHFALFTLV